MPKSTDARPSGKGDTVLIIECSVQIQQRGRSMLHGTVVISCSLRNVNFELDDSDKESIESVVRELIGARKLL